MRHLGRDSDKYQQSAADRPNIQVMDSHQDRIRFAWGLDCLFHPGKAAGCLCTVDTRRNTSERGAYSAIGPNDKAQSAWAPGGTRCLSGSCITFQLPSPVLDYWFSSSYSIGGKSIIIIGDRVDEYENYFDEDDRDDTDQVDDSTQ